MLKKVFHPLALALLVLFSLISCDMPSQADFYKKKKSKLTSLSFTLNFDANGGYGSMNPTTYKIGEEITIPSPAFTAPTGLKFGQWNTSKDGTGASYVPGEKSTIDSTDATFYAIWIDKAAHSIYYYNTRDAQNNNPTSYFESKTVTIEPLSLENFAFVGWYRNSSYSGAQITGWGPGTYTTDMRLYARWVLVSITYDLDGGYYTSGSNPTTIETETDYTLRSPYKPGFVFDGWYDQDGNLVTVITSEHYGKKLILTARYSKIRYTIKYHSYYGKTVHDNPTTYTADDEIILEEPARTDRIFMGWYNNSERRPQDLITKIEKGTTGNLDIYAKWKNPTSTALDISEVDRSNLSAWVASNIDTSRTDNKLEIGGDLTTDEVLLLIQTLGTYNQYIEEIDFTELNVTRLFTSDYDMHLMRRIDHVKKITMPESLEKMNVGTFTDCINLEEVILNDFIVDMLWGPFEYCSSLKEITIPDSVEWLPQTAFYYCTSLEKINISKNSNIELIGLAAFEGCTSLKEIFIPPKVTHLNNIGATFSRTGSENTSHGSFNHCTALTTVTFCKTLTKINSGTFEACNNITTINYEGTEEEWQALLPNIGTNNGSLLTATVNYNYEIPY